MTQKCANSDFLFSNDSERGISKIGNIIIGPSFCFKRKLLKTPVAGAITFHDSCGLCVESGNGIFTVLNNSLALLPEGEKTEGLLDSLQCISM
jgi:hypothetical protein